MCGSTYIILLCKYLTVLSSVKSFIGKYNIRTMTNLILHNHSHYIISYLKYYNNTLENTKIFIVLVFSRTLKMYLVSYLFLQLKF